LKENKRQIIAYNRKNRDNQKDVPNIDGDFNRFNTEREKEKMAALLNSETDLS
jgi:hypothetical protein